MRTCRTSRRSRGGSSAGLRVPAGAGGRSARGRTAVSPSRCCPSLRTRGGSKSDGEDGTVPLGLGQHDLLGLLVSAVRAVAATGGQCPHASGAAVAVVRLLKSLSEDGNDLAQQRPDPVLLVALSLGPELAAGLPVVGARLELADPRS